MARRPITNPLEYLQMARRRWLWILVPTVLIAGLTFGVARFLPKLYSSEALILVEPQQVPTDLVTPTVSGNVANRLESIREQILSRTQLTQLIQKYGLYKGQGLTEDGEVTRMLSDITVTPIVAGNPNSAAAQVSAFTIDYQGRDPLQAQEVTSDLSNLFINENLKARAAQAEGTENFIDSQLTQANQTLQTLEGQLRQLKSQYMGSLPEQQGANLTVLGQLQTVLQANADALARAQQQKTYLVSLGQAVAGLSSTALPAAPPSQAELDLHKAESDLATAQQLYTPEHPMVINLEAKVRALTQQVAAAKKAAAPVAAAAKPTLPPQDQSQITVLDQEIKQRNEDQKATNAKITAIQARIAQLPEVEEKLANLQNSYDVAKATDTKLLEQKAAAATGAAMEQQAEGQQFRIVDPANLPQKPSSPNLVRIDLMGGLGGLVIGLGLGFLAEMREPVVRCELDLGFYTQTAVLAALPLLPPARPAVRALSSGEGQ